MCSTTSKAGNTVTRLRSDWKALKREREKKIAAGHKPDDREDYTMQQTL